MAKELTSLNIGIFGPGAIGGLLAALLYRAGFKVYCFGTEGAVKSIKSHGIQIKSSVYGDFNSKPICSTTASVVVDLLFVTIKSPSLNASLKAMHDCIGDSTVIVSLLNGIGHREALRKVYGNKVVVGTIGAVEVSLGVDRVVQHSSPMIPHVEIASEDIDTERLTVISSLIKCAGLSATIRENENEVIWKKLVRLCAIATMTALTNLPVGLIRSDIKLRKDLTLLVEELSQICLAQGVVCSVTDVLQQIDDLPGGMTTSMQRDINLGRVSEIDSILAEPIRLGSKLGLSLPAIEQSYLSLKSKIGC